jgi:hypothetical protein
MLVLLAVCFAPQQAAAQSRPGFRDANANKPLYNSRNAKHPWLDNVQAHTGAFMEFFPVYIDPGQGRPQEAFSFPPLYYGVNVGGQYVFWNKNDFLSLSANASTNIAISYSSWSGVSFMWQLPAFLTFRIGSNCTRYNQNAVGGGIGIGVVTSYILLPYRSGTGPVRNISQIFASPSVMAEVNFGKRVTHYSVRFHIDILPFPAKLTVEAQPGQRTTYNALFRNFGLGFLYYFR